jgi:hypothetical protein
MDAFGIVIDGVDMQLRRTAIGVIGDASLMAT